MVIYDPMQKRGSPASGLTAISSTLSTSGVASSSSGTPNTANDILKSTPPALVAFIANLPAVDGPSPDIDFVLSICLQSNIPTVQIGKSGTPSSQLQTAPALSTSDLSGSNKFKSTRDRQPGKRKDLNRQDDEITTVQSQPLPRDAFKIRQLRKVRGTGSQTGSQSYGSAFSGELSGSTS
ncbi:unnamed protein product [Ilex paraguariensis]|uniref:Uncharacterized protein n=1 Tax=Ilex paraguariensis TaxID=185542 RepID=A0ABC8S8P7_9AQUA